MPTSIAAPDSPAPAYRSLLLYPAVCGLEAAGVRFAFIGTTGATNRYPRLAMVWMTRGSLASSSNTRRNSKMERVSTPSPTNVSGQTVLSSASLDSGSPGCSARRTSTDITFGSSCTVVPLRETVFRLGWTNQDANRKSPSTTQPQVHRLYLRFE